MKQIIDKKLLIFVSFIYTFPYLFRFFDFDVFIINYLERSKYSINSNLFKQENTNQKQIMLGYVEFYPYTYTNDVNQPDGLFINESKKLFQSIPQYELNFVSLPASRLFEGLKSGSIQIFIGTPTIPALQGHIIYTNNKLGTIEMRAYSLIRLNHNIQKEHLLGKRIILIRGYGYSGWADYLKKYNTSYVVEALNHEIAFEMLLRNRGEILLEYKEPAETVIQKLKLRNIYYTSIITLDCYYIISKNFKEAESLKNIIDNTFKNSK